VHVKSAWLPGRKYFTVKVATRFLKRSRRSGIPGSGVVAGFDAETGDLRALPEDEHHLSDVRTAAAGADVGRMLARADASVLSVFGSGVQAYLQTLTVAAERLDLRGRCLGQEPRQDADVHVRRAQPPPRSRAHPGRLWTHRARPRGDRPPHRGRRLHGCGR
jgi:Ornithine cyclodeaminase/mu-crystallin family